MEEHGDCGNCVISTSEETQEDDDNVGGMDAGWWVCNTSKSGRDGRLDMGQQRQQKRKDVNSEIAVR